MRELFRHICFRLSDNDNDSAAVWCGVVSVRPAIRCRTTYGSNPVDVGPLGRSRAAYSMTATLLLINELCSRLTQTLPSPPLSLALSTSQEIAYIFSSANIGPFRFQTEIITGDKTWSFCCLGLFAVLVSLCFWCMTAFVVLDSVISVGLGLLHTLWLFEFVFSVLDMQEIIAGNSVAKMDFLCRVASCFTAHIEIFVMHLRSCFF